MSDINKIIELIKKTGDRFIVLDANGETYAVMALGDYEKLVLNKAEIEHLTEEELLDKINRDIANWRSFQSEEMEEKAEEMDDLDLNLDKKEEDLVAEDKFYFEPIG